MNCPECGTVNPETSNFCVACGSALTLSPKTTDASTKNRESELQKRQPRPAPSPVSFRVEGTREIDSLGTWSDGWAELVEGAGEQAERLQQIVTASLEGRKVPGYRPHWTRIVSGALEKEQRDCLLLEHKVGASILLYMDKFGNDLYVSWHLFLRMLWRTETIFPVIIIPAGISLIGTVALDGGVGFFIGLFLVWLFVVSGIVMLAGRINKGNPWAYFLQEYNHFRIEEITGLTLGVHKSLLAGLDDIGVDINLLRRKEQFHAGSRERLI